MEKETKTMESSFKATKRWFSPKLVVMSLQDVDVITASTLENKRDVTVDDSTWGLIIE